MPELVQMIPWGILTSFLVVVSFAAGWWLSRSGRPTTAADIDRADRGRATRLDDPAAAGQRVRELVRREIRAERESRKRRWPASG